MREFVVAAVQVAPTPGPLSRVPTTIGTAIAKMISGSFQGATGQAFHGDRRPVSLVRIPS